MNIEFLDGGCGDAIHIRFKGIDDKFHNILVDGGTEKGNIYVRALRVKLQQIVDNDEIVDLWIITHIDDDHIGGVLRLLKDQELLKQINLSKTTFWFNYSIWDYDTGLRENDRKSFKQGIRLRDFLNIESVIDESITDQKGTTDFWGAKITVLSPSEEAYKVLLDKWAKEEIKIRQRETSKPKINGKNDYKTAIKDFDLTTEVQDDSEENASSIAFLLEFNGKSVLFTADSHPDTLIEAITKISPGKKLKLNYMQVPHHGSRYNISNTLLELLDCEHYIICADGFNKSNLPNKISMVKILAANPEKEVNFYITQENELTQNIFSVDTELKINVHFPIKNSCIQISL